MAGRVAGKVAFITGAGRGQGRSHTIRLAQEGADIIAVDLAGQTGSVPYAMSTPDDLADTVKEVEALDRRIVATQADVRDYGAVKAALVVASMRTGPGYAMHVPAAIRAAVGIPVIGAGRITSPQEAEQVLAAGQCDLVGVVRGQIADPDFTVKAQRGDAAAIRTCLSCNQECAGRVGATAGSAAPATRGPGGKPCRCRHRSRRRVAGPAWRAGCTWPAAAPAACRRR